MVGRLNSNAAEKDPFIYYIHFFVIARPADLMGLGLISKISGI